MGRVTMELTPMERDVVEHMLRGGAKALATLRGQLRALSVSKREYTGVGLFTYFDLPADVPRLEIAKCGISVTVRPAPS